jgi:hypothetical protein
MTGANRFAGSTFPAGRYQVGSRWEDDHWFEAQDIINFYDKCDVDGGKASGKKLGASREFCRPRPGIELTDLEKRLINLHMIITESHPDRRNCEIIFLDPLPESQYVPKEKLLGGKLTQQVVRNLTVHVRKGALPDEAARNVGVRDTAFWKAFAVGITASPKKAEREFFRAVMRRLQPMV